MTLNFLKQYFSGAKDILDGYRIEAFEVYLAVMGLAVFAADVFVYD